MLRLGLQRRAWLCVALLQLFGCHSAGPVLLALRPGLQVSGRVKLRKPQKFAFMLRRGQFVALQVTQESVDVVLTLRLPDALLLPPLDTQAVVPVPELLRVVAPLDGRYVLEVAGASEDWEPFQLEVLTLRTASDGDRLVAQAQEDLAEAEELRRRNTSASSLRALPLYVSAVQRFTSAGDAGGQGYARLQWARVLDRQGLRQEEVAVLRDCLALPAAAEVPGIRAKAATMLGEALSTLGRGAEADVVEREALALWKQLHQPAHEAQVINLLAHRASERGELALAETLYRQALAAWESGGGYDEPAAVVLGSLAAVYNLAGEAQLALDTADRALARFPRGASPEDVAEVLALKGDLLADLDRPKESQEAVAAALDLCRAKPTARAKIERRVARRAYGQGNFEEAARRLTNALHAFEAVEDLQSALAVRQDLAWTELKRGHLEVADALFNRLSSGGAGPSENGWIRPAALAGRARVERLRGHLPTARGLAMQALDEVEHLRHGLGRSDLQTSVFASQQSFFDLAVDLTLDLYDRSRDAALLVDAFEISERSRARLLLDLLATDVAPPRPLQPAETRAAKALSRAEEGLKALREAAPPPGEIERAEREVRQAVLALRRERGSLETPEAGFGGTPLSARQIQRWIDRDTVLLEFDLGEDASYLWIVSQRSLTFHRLPRQPEIDSLARKAVAVLSTQGASAESVQSRETLLATSRFLLAAAMPELAARRWLVVSDGALHSLPVGALPNPVDSGQVLLATHEIAYAPSASVAVRLAERSERQQLRGAVPGKELAVLADAAYEAESPAGAASSASSQPMLGGLLRLPRLRYTGEEAERILAFVAPEARLDARRFEATKAKVLSGELSQYRRLHFAVHGLPDENHPELSGLALSLFDRQGKPLDGILFAHEIARLHLPAELAVLSACQSGRGARVSGEGLVGLAHAFFTAGTARVVVSHWSVNDQATAELMTRFYEGLLVRHLQPVRALQEAQLALAGETPWRRPYFWAGFAVQGGF